MMPTLTFHDYACFLLQPDGTSVVIDPFFTGNPDMHYDTLHAIAADPAFRRLIASPPEVVVPAPGRSCAC